MVNFASNISWGYNFSKSNTLTAECQGRVGLCTQHFSTTYSSVPLKYLISVTGFTAPADFSHWAAKGQDPDRGAPLPFHSLASATTTLAARSQTNLPSQRKGHEGSKGLINKRRPRVKRDKSFTHVPHSFLAPLPYLQKVDNITWRGKIQMLPATVSVPKKCG